MEELQKSINTLYKEITEYVGVSTNVVGNVIQESRLEQNILEEFDKTEPVRGKVFDYLRTHRLDQLLNHVEDFTL